MISKTAMTYGGALYDLAREESLEEQILGELHAVSDLFRQNPDYTKLLMEPSIEKQERAKLIDEAWGGSVHPYTQNFMKLLCDNGTISALPDCFEAFRGRYNRDHDIIDVCAVSAVPLTEAQAARLREKLEANLGGIREMRKHVAWYTAGFPHSAKLRAAINQVESLQALEQMLNEWERG